MPANALRLFPTFRLGPVNSGTRQTLRRNFQRIPKMFMTSATRNTKNGDTKERGALTQSSTRQRLSPATGENPDGGIPHFSPAITRRESGLPPRLAGAQTGRSELLAGYKKRR